MPQVIVNKQKWKEAIEELELSREFARHVSWRPIREFWGLLSGSTLDPLGTNSELMVD
jgi:hypothetical protein